MGLFSWFSSGSKEQKKDNTAARKPHQPSDTPAKKEDTAERETREPSEAAGMNGAVEVRRHNPPPIDVTVLEIGSADKEVLAGYCPVSNMIEPCTWKVLPAREDSSKIRIVF